MLLCLLCIDCLAEESKPTGNLTVGECLRLAKAMTDHTQLPASCKDYIDKHLAVQKAYEGAGGNMVRTLFYYIRTCSYTRSTIFYALTSMASCAY
jgi:hypothetical protein